MERIFSNRERLGILRLQKENQTDTQRSGSSLGKENGKVSKYQILYYKKQRSKARFTPLLVRVERLELPTSCSQTVELNFLWLFIIVFDPFRSIPLTL